MTGMERPNERPTRQGVTYRPELRTFLSREQRSHGRKRDGEEPQLRDAIQESRRKTFSEEITTARITGY